MSGGGNYGKPVKVVIINTQYVEADPRSFKSVVQRLTGKDSTVELKPPASTLTASGRQTGSTVATGNSVMSLGVSFQDLDRLLMELPSLDELYRICMD